MSASYFSHPFVSNSMLTKLKNDLSGRDQQEFVNAYRIGTLVDAVITTPNEMDYIQRTVVGTGYSYTDEEIEHAKQMRRAFMADPYCAQLLKHCVCQKEVYVPGVAFNYQGVDFTLDMKCKPDFYSEALGFGPDLKTTAAATQQGFYDACVHFDYPRSRALYMRLCGFHKDMLIGISKVNYKIFKIPIVYGDKFHQMGVKQFEELSFKYYMLKS